MHVRARLQSASEELANAITHGLGLAGAGLAAPLLVAAAVRRGDAWQVVGAAVFAATLVLMYVASTLYHACPPGPSLRLARRKHALRTFDHSAIYLLIAGTYTPFLLGPMRGPWGWSLFAAEWALAAGGIAAKLYFGFRWPRLSTWVYVGMGWLAIVAAGPLWRMVGATGAGWLLAGGLCYTLGVVFYATDSRYRFHHAVWHVFVAGGSACHVWAALHHAAGAAGQA